MRRLITALSIGVLSLTFWVSAESTASAQQAQPVSLNRYYYYPYYYFPHSYWPSQSPQWPEPKGAPYMKPPAYMAYPAFREPHWRYPLWERRTYYRGFHFWLDQF